MGQSLNASRREGQGNSENSLTRVGTAGTVKQAALSKEV